MMGPTARDAGVKMLINATTITVGGGVQAAVSFVEFASKLGPTGPSFAFALSRPVFDALPERFRCVPAVHVWDDSPAHPLKGRAVRVQLLQLEEQFAPDLVYSIGFPSYVVFTVSEAGRYTNGWEICAFPAARAVVPVSEQIGRCLRSLYRLRWARHARFFETQTAVAKAGIVRKLGVAPDKVYVLPNSVNRRFIEAGTTINAPRPIGQVPKVLCLSAAFRHKNLGIVPSVAKHLLKRFNVPCAFVLTLPFDSELWGSIRNEAARLGVEDKIHNVGPLDLDGCVMHYRESDCVFLPTLAEIFSATYIEAMAMRVPIVTTDLDFARDICQDAAVYYDPLSAEAAAAALHGVLTEESKREALIAKGVHRLRAFPDPDTKHRLLLNWLISVARNGDPSGRPRMAS